MKRVLILLVGLFLAACGGNGSDPDAVAKAYWAALQKGDEVAMNALTVSQEAPTVGPFSGEMKMAGDKVEEIRLQPAIVDKDGARVPTVVVPEPQEGQANIGEVSFDTRLVRVDGEWKVDRTATDQAMIGAIFGAAMGAMGQAMSEGIQGAVKDIGKVMTESMQTVAEGMAAGLDETKKALEESGRAAAAADGKAQQIYLPPVVLPARVSGSIRGTNVELTHAEYANTLAIYAGDGWGFNPSLLVFLFLDEGETPAGKTFDIKAGDKTANRPHVHYRWRDPQSGDIESEVASSAYDMVLKFGEAIGGQVLGEIRFSVPGEATRVVGTFKIQID